jgi:hypothetical protein
MSSVLTRSTSLRLAGPQLYRCDSKIRLDQKDRIDRHLPVHCRRCVAPTLTVSGSVTPAGSVQRSTLKTFASTIAPSGGLVRSIAKRLSGLISVGDLITSFLGTVYPGDAEMLITSSNRS